MISPLERRLQLITGKGGTGKTTLTAALGLAHAARGKRPLLVELGHRASLARVLGVNEIDHEIREILPGVHATNLQVHHATHALVRRALPSGVTARLLRSAPIRTFLDAAPGVGEVATLDRIRSFVDETDFDPILVDGDATGHTRMLFALHGVLAGLGVGGPIADLLDRASGIFADAGVAAVHLAALPTSLAIEETVELWNEIRAGERVALGHVLLDRVEGRAARDLAPADLEAAERNADAVMASAIGLLRVDRERWERADVLRDGLSKRGMSPRAIDEVESVLDLDSLLRMGRGLLESVS